jgi:hypothetical protein
MSHEKSCTGGENYDSIDPWTDVVREREMIVDKGTKLRIAAMRMAAKIGMNPYDSVTVQASSYEKLARMQIGRVKSEIDANRLLAGRKG